MGTGFLITRVGRKTGAPNPAVARRFQTDGAHSFRPFRWRPAAHFSASPRRSPTGELGFAPLPRESSRQGELHRYAVEKSDRHTRLSRFAVRKSAGDATALCRGEVRLVHLALPLCGAKAAGPLHRFAPQKSDGPGRLSRCARRKSAPCFGALRCESSRELLRFAVGKSSGEGGL